MPDTTTVQSEHDKGNCPVCYARLKLADALAERGDHLKAVQGRGSPQTIEDVREASDAWERFCDALANYRRNHG